MKPLFTVITLLMIASQVNAQAQSDSQVVRYDEATNSVVQEPAVQGSAQASQNAPIYILNNQKFQGSQGVNQEQKNIQEQPATIVEAAPLRESKADALRRARQNMEAQTEQRIVEKLEEGRIEDEKARAERLFQQGGASSSSSAASSSASTTLAPSYPAATQSSATSAAATSAAAVIELESKDESKEEIKAELSDIQADITEDKASYYVSGHLGMGQYPDAVNIRGKGATGFSLGLVTPERLVVEGTFMYSNYDVEIVNGVPTPYPPFKELSQYNLSGAVKYQFLPGRLRPVLGAIAAYTYRSYTDRYNSFGPYYAGASQDVSSTAVDVGVLAGLDVQLTRSFALGTDFRYMRNVTFDTNSAYRDSFVNPSQQYGRPIEDLDYYVFSVSGKFTF